MPQDPAFPPQRSWQFPPPKVGRGWTWLAVLGSTVGGLVLVGTITALIVTGMRDTPGLIDDVTVLDRIDTACGAMTTTVEGMPAGDSPEDRAAVVADQNAAVEQMIEQVEELDPDTRAGDRPLAAWLDDWRDLVTARDDYAAAVLSTRTLDGPEVEVPLDPDGHPITDRMVDALFDPVCEVPEVLVDPDSASDLST